MVCPGPMFIVSSCTQGSRGHDTLGEADKTVNALVTTKNTSMNYIKKAWMKNKKIRFVAVSSKSHSYTR
jgi:hypothetical protein